MTEHQSNYINRRLDSFPSTHFDNAKEILPYVEIPNLGTLFERMAEVSPSANIYACKHSDLNEVFETTKGNDLHQTNECTSVFDDELEQQFTQKIERHLYGPGGNLLITRDDVRSVLPDESVTILFVTWNLAAKCVYFKLPFLIPKTASSLEPLLKPRDLHTEPDLYCISFQELAISSMCHRRDIQSMISTAIGASHLTYCWVRKWTQMFMLLIRKSLLGFISDGSKAQRVSDYGKISKSLRFSRALRQEYSALKSAHVVIWFGDLNFRMTDAELVTQLLVQKRDSYRKKVLISDQLTKEMKQGKIFEKFAEPSITFDPTHKFHEGTNDYVEKRVPSYTDRVLYRNNTDDQSTISSILYNSLSFETMSDHKPVYSAFTVRVIRKIDSES